MLARLEGMNLVPCLVAAAPSIAFYVLRSWRWRELYRDTGEVVGFWPLFHANVIGYFGNSFLPARAGDAMRLIWATRATGYRTSRLLGTIVMERMLDLTAVAIILCVAGTVAAGIPSPFFRAAEVVGIGALSFVIAVVFFPGTIRDAAIWVIDATPLRRWRTLLLDWCHQLLSGGKPLRRVTVLIPIISVTALIWSADAACLMLAGRAVSVTFPLVAGFSLSACLALSSAVPSTPGYIGVYQVVAVSVLSLFGIPADAAIAAIVVYQALSYVLISTLAGVSFFALAGARASHSGDPPRT